MLTSLMTRSSSWSSDRRIVDLEFMDKEMHPTDFRQKRSVYDLLCKTDDGSRVIVEVQRRKQDAFIELTLYYSTFQIARQVETGASEYDFCPVYVVNIREFTLDQNAGNLEVQPKALKHKVFDKIFEMSELLRMNEDTRLKVLDSMTTERDLQNQFAYARKLGFQEGREEGLEKGMEEGKEVGLKKGREEGRRTKALEIAEKLKATGMALDEISAIVGLPIEVLSVN